MNEKLSILLWRRHGHRGKKKSVKLNGFPIFRSPVQEVAEVTHCLLVGKVKPGEKAENRERTKMVA